MTDDLLIRPATAKDIAFIMTVNTRVDQHSVYKPPHQLSATRLTQDLFGPKPRAFVDIAVHNYLEVGLVFYSFCYYASEGEGIWITNIYSDPICRRQGIAKSLIEHLKQKHPHVCGMYGAISQHNRTARHFANYLGGG